MIEPIDRFSLEQHTGPYESWPKETALYDRGLKTRTCVSGYVIERQYRIGEEFLLILSYDCPFEEAANFVLLDRGSRVTCERLLGGWYTSYLLMDATIIGERELRLRFAGEEYWRLEVRTPRWFGRRLRLRPE